MYLLFTFILIAIVLAALAFFKYFTKSGTVPLPVAWRAATVWLSAVGMVLGQFIVDVLTWIASFWDPFRQQFGDLLTSPSAGMALQLLSAVFFLVRMKGQGFPQLRWPTVPNESDGR